MTSSRQYDWLVTSGSMGLGEKLRRRYLLSPEYVEMVPIERRKFRLIEPLDYGQSGRIHESSGVSEY